jgi:hypothetical protein
MRFDTGAWACMADCFPNNPQVDLLSGLGEMEIKAESLRFVACANNDLLADSAFNIEAWLWLALHLIIAVLCFGLVLFA